MTITRVKEDSVHKFRGSTVSIMEEVRELRKFANSEDAAIGAFWWRKNRDLMSWSDGLDENNAMDIADAGGLSDQTEKCRAILDKLPQVMQTTQEQGYFWDVWGSAWDMGALLAGEPEVGLQFDTVEVKNPCVKIVVDMFYSCDVPAAQLTQRASALTALLAALNSMGYAVELDLWCAGVCSYKDKGKDKIEALVEVHNPGRVFDLARIAYWCGHPAAMRQIIYPVIERGFFETQSASFGSCLPWAARTLEKKEECRREGWLYIQSAYADLVDEQYSTPEKAAKWIAEQVDNINKTHTMSKED